jgi:hypothetical protein
MLMLKGSQDLYMLRNAAAVLAVLCLSAFMAFTAVLLILSYDGTAVPLTQELPSD